MGKITSKQACMELGHTTSQNRDSGKDQKHNSSDGKGVRYTANCTAILFLTATHLLHDFNQITSHSSAFHVKQDKDLQQLHSAWK